MADAARLHDRVLAAMAQLPMWLASDRFDVPCIEMRWPSDPSASLRTHGSLFVSTVTPSTPPLPPPVLPSSPAKAAPAKASPLSPFGRAGAGAGGAGAGAGGGGADAKAWDRSTLQKGDLVDVLDNADNRWRHSQVLDSTPTKLLVHYKGHLSIAAGLLFSSFSSLSSFSSFATSLR